MKITQLAAKPKLIQITIDDQEVIQQYGESLEFYMWDRQPMSKFIKLATVKEENYHELIDAVQDMILDEQGEPVLRDDTLLPTGIMGRVVAKVVETLGK
jgi:hypothetical protein